MKSKKVKKKRSGEIKWRKKKEKKAVKRNKRAVQNGKSNSENAANESAIRDLYRIAGRGIAVLAEIAGKCSRNDEFRMANKMATPGGTLRFYPFVMEIWTLLCYFRVVAANGYRFYSMLY